MEDYNRLLQTIRKLKFALDKLDEIENKEVQRENEDEQE